ncbi:transcriptional regulator [Virgibacillus profundi]|uniref:Transcriptional regulator n=1 Tax=Virgibacillus profundi TaxID=2024555 RepID=A0A2A2IHZ5_9BACI|nr:ROK family transcriptional regulator [Virgibacillus profundi]PAV30760.1 transcriptional regulator [Virgibacillus profundi]PXY54943.1 ROK family transcriptional regulator [Virgibacillus profundi]
MRKQRTGDLKLIQELNRSIILDAIRKKGPISRSGIAKSINISPTTVTSAVSDLINEGLVYEDGVGTSSGGRKPVLIRFNPDSHSIIGVSLSNSYIRIADMNLEGKILRKEIHQTNQLKGQEIIQFILEVVDRFLVQKQDIEYCQGISIISPGIVNAEKGIISYNSKLNLYGVPLKELIEERTNLPAFLDNDANAFVLAENYFGLFSKYKDLLYITIGDGVGSGMMVNGSIYRGYLGSSGEVGHTTVVECGIKCSCGNRGCLENYVNWPAIYSKIVTAIVTRSRDTIIKEMVLGDLNRINPDIFVEAINEGDKLAQEIMEDTMNYLSIAITNTIHFFNPEVIILSGGIIKNNPLFLEGINKQVEAKVIPTLKEEVNIQGTSLGSEFEPLGAAAVILHGNFKFQMI